MLEIEDIASYLLARGFIDAGAIVDGELTIVDLSRRNRVYLVTATRGRCFAVKLARAGERSAVDRESAVLARLARAAAGTRLAGRLPVVVARDADMLVVETHRGAHDLARHHGHHARGRFSRALARDAGRVLASLHALPVDTLSDIPGPDERGWGLRVHRPDLDELRTLSGAAVELVRHVQSSGELCDALDALRASPREEAPIHGDVRWQNWLVPRGTASGRRDRVELIDWELACTGDRCLDIGAFFAEYLRLWVQSIPISDPRRPGRLIAHARRPLGRMQPALRSFWDGYATHAGRAHTAPLLLRATRFAAVRLIEAAVEQAQARSVLPARALLEVQLATNILARPDAAATRLLGLDAVPAAAA